MLSRFSIPFEELPVELSIFPLQNILLLPYGRLPLNIFEPRYVNMVLEALGEGRMIGIVQTLEATTDPVPDDALLCNTGCVGRIIAFSEVPENRIFITLHGLCRFNITSEHSIVNGYRRVHSDFSPYKTDMDIRQQPLVTDELTRLFRDYFEVEKLQVDWSEIKKINDQQLLANLTMMCPFDSREKKALIEARDIDHMVEILTTLMEMAVKSSHKYSIKN